MLSRFKCLPRSCSAASLSSLNSWSPALNFSFRTQQHRKQFEGGTVLLENKQTCANFYEHNKKQQGERFENGQSCDVDLCKALEDDVLKSAIDICGLRRIGASCNTVSNNGSFLRRNHAAGTSHNSPYTTGLHADRDTLLANLDIGYHNQIRRKVTWPSKNALRRLLSRDFELEQTVKLAEKSVSEKLDDIKTEPKQTSIPLSNLLMGCTSPQHLFDLIAPFMERNEMGVTDCLIALEQLQILVYQDIIQRSPTMSDNVIPILYLVLKLNGQNETAFQAVNSNPKFVELCKRLENFAPTMNETETITCFFGMTFLGLSFENPLMISLFEKVQRLPDDNLSLFDISMLYQAVRAYIRPDIMTVVHINPKLRHFFAAKTKIPNDKKIFGHLLFLLDERLNLNLSPDSLKHVCEEMYRICKETDNMKDPVVATSFLRTIHSKSFKIGTNFFSGPLLSKMDTLTDIAFDWLDQNLDRLSPLQMSKLWPEVKSFEGTDIRCRLQKQAVELILSKQLKVSEVVWLGSIGTKELNLSSDTLGALKVEVQSKLEHMTHSILTDFLKLWDDNLIEQYDLGVLVQQKVLEHAGKLFQYYSSANLMFNFLLFWKCGQLSGKYDLDFQQVIQEMSESPLTYSLGVQHHINTFLFLIGREWLTPPCVQILANLAPKVLPRMPLKLIARVNHSLGSIHSKPSFSQRKLYMNNYENYRAAILSVLINTTRAGFHHYLSSEFTSAESLLKSISRLILKRNNDPLFLEVLMEQILHVSKSLQTLKDFDSVCYVVTHVRYYHKDICASLVSFALKNKESFSDEFMFLNFLKCLAMVCYTLEDPVNAELVEFIQKFIEKKFELFTLRQQFQLLIFCNRLGVKVDAVMKKVFSLEYLQRVDELITSGDVVAMDAKKAIFLLNRDACIDYPHLNIPWFQSERMAAHFEDSYGRDRLPFDLSSMIRAAVGGIQFVGFDIPVEYGFILWRVVLLNKDNQLVEFRADNLKYADELGLKRYCFWYFGEDTADGHYKRFTSNSRRLVGKEYNRIRQLEELGYNCVLIYDTEWYSIGLTNPRDKIEFLRAKLAKGEKRCLQTSRVLSEENISGVINQMLPVDGDAVSVAPSQI